MSGMRKLGPSEPESLRQDASCDDLIEELPLLAEYLCCATWDDGSPRLTATLLLMTEFGVWKACLNDRANTRALWVTAGSYTTVLSALEAALSVAVPGWRPVKAYPSKR